MTHHAKCLKKRDLSRVVLTRKTDVPSTASFSTAHEGSLRRLRLPPLERTRIRTDRAPARRVALHRIERRTDNQEPRRVAAEEDIFPALVVDGAARYCRPIRVHQLSYDRSSVRSRRIAAPEPDPPRTRGDEAHRTPYDDGSGRGPGLSQRNNVTRRNRPGNPGTLRHARRADDRNNRAGESRTESSDGDSGSL